MRYILLVFSLFITQNIYSQFSVHGIVTRADTKKPLVGCSVFNLNTQMGTVTNEKGHYSIPVNKGDQIQFSYVGMVVITKYIIDTTSINIEMSYITHKIRDVVITSGNLAKNSVLYNPNYERYKDYQQTEPERKTAKEYRQEALTGTPGTFSPISLIYYSLPKVRRRLQAVIDIKKLDASNQKFSLDFISMVTGETDQVILKDIKAYCYLPADEVLDYSYYQLGQKLEDCYIDYLTDPNKPKPVDSTEYIKLEKR